MSAFYLLIYLALVFGYVKLEARESHIRITLAIDSEYLKKANHAALYATPADCYEIRDACRYFLGSRR